jgi:hypothetical protein
LISEHLSTHSSQSTTENKSSSPIKNRAMPFQQTVEATVAPFSSLRRMKTTSSKQLQKEKE